jgi:hypothetical protein
VADVLQSVIKQARINIRHPLFDEACLVLQYVDDTLLVLRVDVNDVQHLKLCLDQFAQASGLDQFVTWRHVKTGLMPLHPPGFAGICGN